jgi:predicted transcriptional regulator of viral defense system
LLNDTYYANNIPMAPREFIVRLARASRGSLVTVERARRALGLSPRATTVRLSRLAQAGWLRRVRRGLYLVLPLEARSELATTVEDPWILAEELFTPCYVGGWSAAEHWGLTEQIFRSVFVVTAGPVRRRSVTFAGVEFRVVRTSARRVKAAGAVWRGAERVAASDRERTLADGLSSPEWVGGVRHLAGMLATYRASRDWNPAALLRAVRALRRGSAMKRLGYLAEVLWPADIEIPKAALQARSAGLVKLDPAIRSVGRISNRWGLRVNASIEQPAVQ